MKAAPPTRTQDGYRSTTQKKGGGGPLPLCGWCLFSLFPFWAVLLFLLLFLGGVACLHPSFFWCDAACLALFRVVLPFSSPSGRCCVVPSSSGLMLLSPSLLFFGAAFALPKELLKEVTQIFYFSSMPQ